MIPKSQPSTKRGEVQASFEPRYPELFELFRTQGWSPGAYSPMSSGYPGEAARFVQNSCALQMDLELGGISFRVETPASGWRDFRFVAGETFQILTNSYLDYDEDVLELLPGDPFPVGEGFGMVLFVAESGAAALFSDILNACFHATDPFILLDHMLHKVDYTSQIQELVVAQGSRLTGRSS